MERTTGKGKTKPLVSYPAPLHLCRYLDQAPASKADQDSSTPPSTHRALPETVLSPPPPPTRPVSPPQKAEKAPSTQATQVSSYSFFFPGTRSQNKGGGGIASRGVGTVAGESSLVMPASHDSASLRLSCSASSLASCSCPCEGSSSRWPKYSGSASGARPGWSSWLLALALAWPNPVLSLIGKSFCSSQHLSTLHSPRLYLSHAVGALGLGTQGSCKVHAPH